MKKIILFLSFIMTVGIATAQSNYGPNVVKLTNKYVERVESNISLKKTERIKLFDLKCEHTKQYVESGKALKGQSEKLATKRKEISKAYMKTLIAAFGKVRAVEISKASRVKK